LGLDYAEKAWGAIDAATVATEVAAAASTEAAAATDFAMAAPPSRHRSKFLGMKE